MYGRSGQPGCSGSSWFGSARFLEVMEKAVRVGLTGFGLLTGLRCFGFGFGGGGLGLSSGWNGGRLHGCLG